MSLVSIFNLFPTATYFTYIVKLVLTSIANPPPPRKKGNECFNFNSSSSDKEQNILTRNA